MQNASFKALNSHLMDYQLTPRSSICPACLCLIEQDQKLETLSTSKEEQLVKEKMKSITYFIVCSTCKLKYHEECAGKSPSMAHNKSRKLGSKNFECENCSRSDGQSKCCLICRSRNGCVKFITTFNGQSLYAHSICVYFSSNFFLTGAQSPEYEPINAEAVNAYFVSDTSQPLCQICGNPMCPGDSFFQCYCDAKAHMYCALFSRAAAIQESEETGQSELPRIPILYLNHFKKIASGPCKLSFDLALHTLAGSFVDKMLTRHTLDFYREKLAPNLSEQTFGFSVYQFKMNCGICNVAKSQYCCNDPAKEDFVMCCLCSDWIHRNPECMAPEPQDNEILRLIFKDAGVASPPKAQADHRGAAKGGKQKQARLSRNNKTSKAAPLSEPANELDDRFYACKRCVNVGVFLSNIAKYKANSLYPANFLVFQFVNKHIREFLGQNYKENDQIVQHFKEKLVLRVEDFSIKAFLKKEFEAVQSTSEIEIFENDLEAFLKKEKLRQDEFEVLRSYFAQKVKPLVREKDKRSDLFVNIAFYEELFQSVNGYFEVDNEVSRRKVEGRLKRLIRNEKYATKRPMLRLVVRYLNANFLDPLNNCFKSIEGVVAKSNIKLSAVFDKWLAKPTLQSSDIMDMLEKKVSDAEISEKLCPFSKSILCEKFIQSFCLSKNLVKFLANFKADEGYPFDELKENFELLVSSRTFDPQLAPNAKIFLEKYFAVLGEKKEFDKIKAKLELLKDFHPKTFLDNLSNLKHLTTFDDLARLKSLEFKDILYDAFFVETEKQSLHKEKALNDIIEAYNSKKRVEKITTFIKRILAVVFQQPIAISKEVYNFLFSSVDQYKIQKFLKGKSQNYTLNDLLKLKETINPDICNKFVFNQFCSLIEKARVLEAEINETLKNENYFSNKIAHKIDEFWKRAQELNVKNQLLQSYKTNCEFIELLNYLSNQELHVDYTCFEEYNMAHLDRFLEEDVPFDSLEQLKAFKIEKFVFREIEHLYKKAISKYYESLVSLCSSGNRNLKVSWIKDDCSQLKSCFNDSSKFPLDAYLKIFKEMQGEIVTLLKEFSREEDVLSKLAFFIMKIDDVLDKADKFDIDDQPIKTDLNFLFDLKFHFHLLYNIQWFTTSIQQTQSQSFEHSSPTTNENRAPEALPTEVKVPMLNQFETPRRFYNFNLSNIQSQMPNSSIGNNEENYSFVYSNFLRHNPNDFLHRSDSSKIEIKRPLDKAIVPNASEEGRYVMDMIDRCRVTYEFLMSCSRFFVQSQDLRVEHIIKEFKDNFGLFLKVKTEYAEMNRRIQKAQAEPANIGFKIDEKDVQKLIPKMSKFKFYFSGQENFLRSEHVDFHSNLAIVKKDGEEIIRKGLDELLSHPAVIQIALAKFTNSFIKSTQSEIYFIFFNYVSKILKSNCNRLTKVKSKLTKFLSFMKFNFNTQNEYELISSINLKLNQINEIKEILDQLQQNEESNDTFRLHFNILKDYVASGGFKVSFNYDSFEEFAQEVRILSHLIENNFAEYFNLLKNRKMKIHPSDLFHLKISDKQHKISLINAYYANPERANNQQPSDLLALYYYVRENTTRICYGYDPIIEYKYNIVEKERSEFERNFWSFDAALQALTDEFNKMLKGELSLNNFSLTPYEKMDLMKIDHNKSYSLPLERLYYKIKFFVLNCLKHIIFAKTNKKPWILKDILKHEELQVVIKKLDSSCNTQQQAHSQPPNVLYQSYLLLVNILRYICFLIEDKDRRFINDKFSKGLASLMDQVEIKLEQNFLNSTLITSSEEFLKLGPNALLPSVHFMFLRINEATQARATSEFNKLYKAISNNSKPNNEFYAIYQQLLERLKRNPYFIKNEAFNQQSDTLCLELAKKIDDEKAKAQMSLNADDKLGSDRRIKDLMEPLESPSNADNTKRKRSQRGNGAEEHPTRFRIKNELAGDSSQAPKQSIYNRIFNFVRSLTKKSVLCQQLQSKSFDTSEFLNMCFANDSVLNSYESPSSTNELAKSENCNEFLVKKEDILKSNGSSNTTYNEFLPRYSDATKLKHIELGDNFFRDHCDLKKVKESTCKTTSDNFFEYENVRIFKLSIGEIFIDNEKQSLVLLTRKNPLFYYYLAKTQIFLKFESKIDVEALAKNLNQKIEDHRTNKASRTILAGWLEAKSVKENSTFYASINTLSENCFLKEKFLSSTTYFELYIGRYTALDSKLVQYIDFVPTYKEKSVAFKDLFVFFITNEKHVPNFYEQDCRDNFEVYERFEANESEKYEVEDPQTLVHVLKLSQELLLANFHSLTK